MRPIPALLLALAACSDASGPPGVARELALERVVQGLESPVFLTAFEGDARLFVVEQPGRVRVVRDGELLPEPFLDLSDRVSCCGERGLLGLAFHPDYGRNGLLFASYTDRAGDTRVVRYRVSTNDSDRVDASSARAILTVEQPFANHNGGQLLFGPDGMLYVPLGDGGGGGDPQGHGQDLSTLLGSLLRLDVDGGVPYRVPADNPFVSDGDDATLGEIWAYGLRNPWRIAFDRVEGLLYVADVGQQRWEEVNVVPADSAGVNYGWNRMEGAHCYPPTTTACDRTGLLLPALEYPHDGGACSVTGGVVYRGAALPELRGHYLYADYCTGWIRSFRHADGRATDERTLAVEEVGPISSFGEDGAGEVYVVSHEGSVYRLVAR